MNVYINNTAQEIHDAATISEALTVLNLGEQKGIAVAINNNVIPRSEWAGHVLAGDDKITLIRAAQGG